MKHLWILKKTFKRVPAFPMELEFERVGFEERGKPEYTKKNLSEQLDRTNNKLNPHMEWTPRPDLNPSHISRGRRVLSPLRDYPYSRPSFPAEKRHFINSTIPA